MNIIKPTVKDNGKYWWVRERRGDNWKYIPAQIGVFENNVIYYLTPNETMWDIERKGISEFIYPCELPIKIDETC